MRKGAVRWLDRSVAVPGPYLTLCLSEEEFKQALLHIAVKEVPAWCPSDARTHTYSKNDSLCCIVCLRGWEGRAPTAVAALLVHEAVHVWQQYAEHIGERYEGSEQEAYAIQFISQELMEEFARRLG